MPTYPDRDTLRLRAADGRTLAQRVELAARELALTRRPLTPTRADVGLAPADRRLVSFRERYPGVAETFDPAVLWAAANGHAKPARQSGACPCGWCMARAYAKHRGWSVPRVDRQGRLLLGDPGPDCQAVLGWHPPKPKPARRSRKPAARKRAGFSMAARSSTTPARGGSRTVRVPATVAAAAARHPSAARVDPATAAYNRAAAVRLGLSAASVAHLTGGRR